MEVFQLTPEIPLRFNPTPLNFSNRSRINFCRPLSATSDSRFGTPDSESRNRMFILGTGFVGGFFAEKLKEADWLVSGTCRSESKKKEWEKKGIDLHLFSADSPQWRLLETVKDYTHLLVSIPPLADIGDPMLRNVELVREKLSSGNLQWLCYLSSTSVYGDYGGAWVTEDDPPNPKTQSAKIRLAAEEGWLSLGSDLGLSTQVLRLGGIYGPGRSAIDTLLKREHLSETQLRRASRRFTSRVHVQDICQALQASIENPSSREIYNIVDDDPAPREEVFQYALELIEKRWKRKIETKPFLYESREQSSLRGEKRVSNQHMKDKLGVKLLHPSYKSGLQSIVEKMDNPF
ncbi:NAD(P)-binding Rossmann-fold superfamily protein [Raphanus sativus]|nr:NAD(P)-binding Rossmann-fold superfamily protein [Raphanus sativus]